MALSHHRPLSMKSHYYNHYNHQWWWSTLVIRLLILYPSFLIFSGVLCYDIDSSILSSSSSLFHKGRGVSEPASFEFVTERKENIFDQYKGPWSGFKNNNNNLVDGRKSQVDPTSSHDVIRKKNFFNNNNNNNQRFDPGQKDRFRHWSQMDMDGGGSPPKEQPKWTSSSSSSTQSSSLIKNDGGGDDTKSKTLPFPSLPTLDILEDPGYNYDHGRPTWPLSEYLSDKFNNFYHRNNNKTSSSSTIGTKHHHHHHNSNSNYEWQQLKPSTHFGSSTSGSHHNYDTKFYHLDDEDQEYNRDRDNNKNNYRIYNGHIYNNNDGHGHRYSNNDIRGQPSGTHTTTVSTSTDIIKGNGSGGGGGTESTNRGVHKYGGPLYGGGWGGPHYHPGHYFPPDHYPKKRFRLKIHPGYIAAPLAGLAAFGAASALTNKPLLFELGLVNNKHNRPHYQHHYPHNYPHGHDIHYPGHGWASNLVPVYPHVNPPILTPGAISSYPQYPILKPEESSHHHHHHQHQHHLSNHQGHHHHHGHHHHQNPEPEKKPWWNPFAALTPRD